MLRSLNVCFSRHRSFHWNSLSLLLLFLQTSAEMSPPLGGLPRCFQGVLTTPSYIHVHFPNMSPMAQYWLYFLVCFCPTSPGGICILFISNSKQLSGLIRSCMIWFLPTSPPYLLPLSAPPTSPSHTALRTVPKIRRLLPDVRSLFLQLLFPGMPTLP